MFCYQPTQSIKRNVTEFDGVSSRLDIVTTLPRTWSGRVRRELQAAATGSSVALEGVPVTVDEVIKILADDQPSGVSAEDSALVRGYSEAMQFVLSRADDAAFAWNSELFRSIHTSVMARSWAHRAGLYRDRQVWPTDSATGRQVFLPPPPDEVPPLVDELAEWLGSADAEQLSAPERAALAHVWLAAVHPFRDGNGRTARIAASLVMYRGGYRLPQFTSLEEWWGQHPAEYYSAFACLGETWNPNADVTLFVEAHVGAQCRQVNVLSMRNTTDKLLWSAMEDIVSHELGMDPRAANALWDAFYGRSVSNRYYRSVADLKQITASHDLKQLQTSGLLLAKGEGRAREYVASISLYRRLVELFDLPVDTSGDAEPDAGLRSAVMGALAAKVAGSA